MIKTRQRENKAILFCTSYSKHLTNISGCSCCSSLIRQLPLKRGQQKERL